MASINPWLRPFHNLRASGETELAEGCHDQHGTGTAL
jgi:hypothetical protein